MSVLVYRFLHAQYALQSLQTQRLKVGRVSELNDPMDCAPRVVNYPPLPVDVLNRNFERAILDNAATTFGLLCFSEAVDDPVVWSHYADSHRGMAFGFDFCHGEDLMPVTYEGKRCDLDYTALLDKDGHITRDALVQGFTRKAPSWKYEREHRMFVALDQCTMVGEHYFIHLPKLALKQVVLGVRCRFNAKDISRVLEFGHGATILRAGMNQQYYRMDIAGELTGREKPDPLQSMSDDDTISPLS